MSMPLFHRVATCVVVTGSMALGVGAAGAAADPFGTSASGTVFNPNPVQQLGLQNLTDNKDADDAVFAAAYRSVVLTDLDGSGKLVGRYVRVKSETGRAAEASNGNFPAYHRDSDQFEQVMGYHWVTKAQKYLQHLGFGSALRPVNQRQIELRINQFGGDNSDRK